MKAITTPPKGTSDIYGEALRFRQWVIKTIQETFERFGFEPLETPIIERSETLMGKYGDEAQNLMFWVPDYEVGLRYDHTVPLARFMANNKGSITLPYKRYAIGPVFRGENTQAGRTRQFTQCDFDTVGSSSLTVDAEIVAINASILTALGFGDKFVIQMNDRRLLNAIVGEMGFSDPALASIVMNAWDKLDKMSPEQVFEYVVVHMDKHKVARERLEKEYVPVTTFLLQLRGKSAADVLSALSERFSSDASQSAIGILRNLVSMVEAMNVPAQSYEVNPLLARGLSYYTGPIFETVITSAGLGSVTGGGRFDNLIEALGGPSLPASGSSFGLERLLLVMEKLGLKKNISGKTSVLVTLFDSSDMSLVTRSFEVATLLRTGHITAEVYSGEDTKIGNQIRFADRKHIPYVIVIGPDELSKGVVSLKNLTSGDERKVEMHDLVHTLNAELQ